MGSEYTILGSLCKRAHRFISWESGFCSLNKEVTLSAVLLKVSMKYGD